MTGGIYAGDIPTLPVIQTKAGILEGTSLYHENGYYETVDLLAADIDALNQINKPRLRNGGEITNFVGYQIILPDRFTSKYGIEKGDTITLQIGGSPIDFENKPLYVAGAGGAATLCVQTLLSYGCKIQILNRTKSHADVLINKFNLSCDISNPYGMLSFIPECDYEKSLPLPDSCKFLFAAAYKGASGLKDKALARGITYVDGLRMLYHQGAKSFALWTDTELQNNYGGFAEFLRSVQFCFN